MHDQSKQPSSHAIARAVAQVLERNSLAALATLVEASARVGAKLLVEETGERTGSLGDFGLDEAVASFAGTFLASRAEARTFKLEELISETQGQPDARILFERIEPEPRLVICGAGHVGASLAQLARLIGYRTVLIDDRADFVTRERFPDEDIELIEASNWTDAVRTSLGAGRNVAVAVVTRGHNEDEECMRAIMSTRPDYVGLIGSRRRTNIVLERLREAGIDEKHLRRVRAPIGLDIGAVTPQEVALSILAEIIAERRGGTGAPLSIWRRRDSG
ncbi:MAG: xanthine dehydrogenase accessory factor [Acidobacteriota bacterium]|jgi:xanthine dehydrogenase accessory factor|nr:xanthine dehydrogenase accessory factor [Acidobacteriota bacterium]